MPDKLKIIYMGTSDFAVGPLKALLSAGYPVLQVVTQPDRPAGRGLELTAPPVKKAALELGLPVLQPEKTQRALEALKALAPDVIVVAAYGQILPASVLQLPKIACLNIHGSLLPKYRGAAPIHYAVMQGEAETGVTVIYMNERMDEGDMMLARRTPIGPGETTGELHDRLAGLGEEALLEALDLLARGKAPRTPQDPSQASYAPSIKREQCRLDWHSPASRLFNRVRGLNPWPSAETSWNGMELKVHRASAESRDGKPGEVLEVSKDGILVAAGTGSLRLREIQPQGKRAMGGQEFANGHKELKAGSVFQ